MAKPILLCNDERIRNVSVVFVKITYSSKGHLTPEEASYCWPAAQMKSQVASLLILLAIADVLRLRMGLDRIAVSLFTNICE